MELQYYVLFPNHENAMRLHAALRSQGLKSTISPTPRRLSKCCGVSLLVEKDEIPAIEKCIVENQIEILKIESTEKDVNPVRDRYC